MTRWILLACALTVAAFGVSGYLVVFEFDNLPDKLPTHWDLYGQPDQWTSKHDVFFVFFLMPTVMVGMILITLALPWLSPRNFEVDRPPTLYAYIMTLTIAFLAYLHIAVLVAQLREGVSIDRLFLSGFFLFFALLGNVLGQVKRNFWIGVRTPWTLASDAVWIQTHRLAAWMFTALGVVGFVATLLGVPTWIGLVVLAVVVLFPIIHSLVVYKQLERAGRL